MLTRFKPYWALVVHGFGLVDVGYLYMDICIADHICIYRLKKHIYICIYTHIYI